MTLKEKLHNSFLENSEKIQEWFESQIDQKDYPFYCSFDIRESGNKLAPVDANLYPAGFNNICQADRDAMGELLERCSGFKNLNFNTVGIFCENHTNNPYYWDNVNAIKSLFESEGKKVFLFTPDEKPEKKVMESASGFKLSLSEPKIVDDAVYVDDEKIDFIVNNNDFSSAYESWITKVKTPSLPPVKMGWHWRRKHSFFEIYNELVEEFSKVIGIDSFHLRVETKNFSDFDIENSEKLENLKIEITNLKDYLSKEYEKRDIKTEPYFFVKNSYGTYGLGVMEVSAPEDVLNWNYKSRKKMKATKGGSGVSSVIIQEGIPTSLISEGSPAEAVIYLLGCGLAGGFLRSNNRKDDKDSLNSPGAVFKRMCFSDYEFQKENRILENVYGTVARLGALALSREVEAAKLRTV